MAHLLVRVPQMLAASCSGKRTIEVDGATVRQALAGAVALHPLLGVHLFDERGGVREHVHVFLNEDDVRGDLDAAVSAGDEVVVLQAVSGG